MTTFPGMGMSSPGLDHDPHWYKRAVFYEVLVRAFADTKASGHGDFTGLISKLDYLQWLGVSCLWLPPFYASPLKDGGYDVADYCAILPEFGTLPDFQELVSQAHARGLRVVTDLVLNHTSDQHPWFEASRSDPDGPYGDYYVWADDDSGYADARIIFIDTETSNWAFDPIRRQFYFHRFFSHQPDLNYENPAVREEILNVARFWLAQGIDGFRLDAVPYLYAQEGTSCENLPGTHDFLAELRAVVDTEFPGRVLLAEANQPPSDVVAYFGTEEKPECHMAFHFPLMTRLFYALRESKAAELVSLMENLPALPSFGQWGTFLRNHDELTLEMATPEERSAMYGWYAPDPRMRSNVGIRRRLAPLLDNSRAELELIHAMLLSMPGSPCLYYGDEIGMGDNIWLEDRDAVRTPMQWTPDRNAGFSSADPGKLYLPVIQSLVFHHNTVNVEAQMATNSSLLHWIRGILQVRALHPAFGVGRCVVLDADNESIFAFLRVVSVHPDDDEGINSETILCLFNLSPNPQATTITMPNNKGAHCRDLFGGARFPSVSDEGELSLTLGSRSFYWLAITT